MRFLIAAVIIILMAAPVMAIDSNKLPFGSQGLRTYTTEEVRKLAEEMCFNYFIEYDTIGPAAIDMLYDQGIQTIKGGLININTIPAQAEAPAKYSWCNYALIDVDYPYPNPEVRMEKFGGNFTNGVWVSGQESIDTLSGISTYQNYFSNSPDLRNHVAFFDRYFFNFFELIKIPYRLDIRAAIDDPDSIPNEIVATVTALVGMWNTCEMKPISVDTIRVSDFGGSSSLQWIQGTIFDIPDTFTVVDLSSTGCDDTHFYTNEDQYGVKHRWNPYLRLDIITTGAREFKVDSIKISDDIGRRMIEDHQYDGEITGIFQSQDYQQRAEKIYAWSLMDEPLFANFMPFHRIDSLMHEEYADWLTFTNFWQYPDGDRLVQTYLSMVDIDYVDPDIYPYGENDVYAGDLFQDTVRVAGVKKYGSLYRLPLHISWPRKSVDQVGKELWLTIQAFEGHGDNPIWRYPTASEMSAKVFISLAWGCRGIQVWHYDPYRTDVHFRAIRDWEGNETRLYDEIRDHIGPYLQAVDSLYLPLTWDACYTYKPDHDYEPPYNDVISSIST